MVNTSARPVSVDGVRLDTLAWNIEAIERATASRRSGDYDIPNLDGVVPSLNDALESTTYGLQMWLRGTDADGAVPGAGGLTTMRTNLDELLHLFGKRHALLDVREQVDAGGTERRAWAKVTDTIAPELATVGTSGRFSVAMVLPYGVWEDVTTQDWVGALNSTATQEVTTLLGASERTNDTIFLVTGPVTNPRITDPNTGMYVELAATLTGTQFWRFNSATWASRYGTGLGLGSADTTGTDGTGLTTVGGPSRAYGLPLTPIRLTANRRTQVVMGGTGFTAATRLSARTSRKYAA